MWESGLTAGWFGAALEWTQRASWGCVAAVLCLTVAEATMSFQNRRQLLVVTSMNPAASTLLRTLSGAQHVESLEAFWRVGEFTLASDASTLCEVTVYAHTPNLFRVFGVPPVVAGSAPSLIVSDHVWKRCLSAQALTPAPTMSLSGRPFVVSQSLPQELVLGDVRPRQSIRGAEVWIQGDPAEGFTALTVIVGAREGSAARLRTDIAALSGGTADVRSLERWMTRSQRDLLHAISAPALLLLGMLWCAHGVVERRPHRQMRRSLVLRGAAVGGAWVLALVLYADLRTLWGLAPMDLTPMALAAAAAPCLILLLPVWPHPWRARLFADSTRRTVVLAAVSVAVTATLVAVAAAALTTTRVGRHARAMEGGDVAWVSRVTPDPRSQATALTRANYYERVLDGARRMPGVHSAALSTGLPGRPVESEIAITFKQSPTLRFGLRIVSPGFFSTVGLPLIGREFTWPEPNDAAIAIVNFAVVQHLLAPSPEALIGQQLLAGRGGVPITIIGVVDDRDHQLSIASDAVVYMPFAIVAPRAAELLVRPDVQRWSPVGLRRAFGHLAPAGGIERLVTLPERLSGSMRWLTALRALGIAIACVTALLLASTMSAAAAVLMDTVSLVRSLGIGIAAGVILAWQVMPQLDIALAAGLATDSSLAIVVGVAVSLFVAAASAIIARRPFTSRTPHAANLLSLL
jgi:hypothetical protein